MSAVLASYVKMSTLVDGTMRIVLDVEPSAAADAFSLLGSPGTSIALARITKEAATAHGRRQQETAEQRSNHSAQGEADSLRVSEGSRPASASPASERKSVSLAGKVAMTVEREDFQSFLQSDTAYLTVWRQAMARLNARGSLDYCSNNRRDIVEEAVKLFCGVERKRDIVAGTPAGERWQDLWFQFTHSGQGRAA